VQALATGLAEYSKIVLISGFVKIKSSLFLKFTPRAFEVFFAGLYEALRH